jgi:hypothetical protein
MHTAYPPVLNSYSAWLLIWVLLASMGVGYDPPLITLVTGSVLTSLCALVLPLFKIYVGVGSARMSLRATVAVIEIAVTMYAVHMHTSPQDSRNRRPVLGMYAIASQVFVFVLYVLYMMSIRESAFGHYMRVLPEALKNVSLSQYVGERISVLHRTSSYMIA